MRTKLTRGLALSALLAMPLIACSGSSEKASGDAVAATPQTPEAYVELAAKLRAEGKFKESRDTALKAFTLGKEGPRVEARMELAKAFGAMGQSASAINEIKQIEAEKRDQGVVVDEVDITEVYAQIGDPNAVFRWLERAIAAGSTKLQTVAANPDFKPVHTDPRWQQMVAVLPK